MKFAENSNQSADYLRQAIPLMVKYNIPPNPLNYALWYTYVSNRLPSLNTQMDQTLETYGTCPTLLGEQMFREHVISDEVAESENVQNQLLALTQNLQEHAFTAAEQTNSYGVILESSLEELSEPLGNGVELESIISRLAENTASISQTTQHFQERISAAQAEINALREELQRTRQDARIDALTGLFNRRVFDAELEQLAGTPDHKTTTLVMIDIDYFKQFNDNYGHLMGDKVLQYFGKVLKETCKEPSLPVRFGGEEFAILMIGQSLTEALELAEMLRNKIQAIRIKQKKSGKVISSITASFGIAQRLDNESADTTVERADAALYRAKENGRNRIEIEE